MRPRAKREKDFVDLVAGTSIGGVHAAREKIRDTAKKLYKTLEGSSMGETLLASAVRPLQRSPSLDAMERAVEKVKAITQLLAQHLITEEEAFSMRNDVRNLLGLPSLKKE